MVPKGFAFQSPCTSSAHTYTQLLQGTEARGTRQPAASPQRPPVGSSKWSPSVRHPVESILSYPKGGFPASSAINCQPSREPWLCFLHLGLDLTPFRRESVEFFLGCSVSALNLVTALCMCYILWSFLVLNPSFFHSIIIR